jgi:hypothetical protein
MSTRKPTVMQKETQLQLPEEVQVFIDAINSRDLPLLRSVLHPEVTLKDPSGEVSGADAVIDWLVKWLIEAHQSIEIEVVANSNVGTVVHANIHGVFDGTGRPQPVQVSYIISLSNGRISSIEIHPAKGSDSLYGMIQGLTIGEISRTEEEIEDIYKTELEKLKAWKKQLTGLGLDNAITPCIESLEKVHLLGTEYRITTVDFITLASKGLSHCLRISWPQFADQGNKLMQKKNELLVEDEMLEEIRKTREKHASMLFDELDRPAARSFAQIVEQIKERLPEEEHFSLQMTAVTLAHQYQFLESALQINSAFIQIGNIWRSFLYAHVIENYGDRLRQDEQRDAFLDLLECVIGRALPGIADAKDAIDSIKKLKVVRNRAKHVPAFFAEVQNLVEYFTTYSNTLTVLGLMLSSYTASIKKSLSTHF